jgi:pre-mRNA-splicing factor RBM22/SLT11
MAAPSRNTTLYNRQTWEDSEFPILCQTCFGDNPYIRMTRESHGGECKICVRPYTVFRWCPGKGMRFKRTEICQVCSKMKNVCQTCLLDLEFGLPTQVRDTALGLESELPTNEVNRDFYMQGVEKELALHGGTETVGQLAQASKTSDMLTKLARPAPYYKRNRAHICSFWVKGSCTRGATCPYRHEMPHDPNGPLAKQNMKDRYYGVNDPVAAKMLARYEGKAPEAPSDKAVTTLYVAGFDKSLIADADLRDHFARYGEVRSVNISDKGSVAFIEMAARDSAEKAIEANANKLVMRGKKLKVDWCRSKIDALNIERNASEHSKRLHRVPGGAAAAAGYVGTDKLSLPGGSEAAAAAAGAAVSAAAAPMMMMAPPPSAGAMLYPSMDPQRLGATPVRRDAK